MVERRLGVAEPAGFDPASQALVGALLRELEGWVEVEVEGQARLELALAEGTLEVPLRRPVGVGRIASGPACWRSAAGERRCLSAPELLVRVLAAPEMAQALGLGSAAAADRLIARVRASTDNLAAVIDARADELERLLSAPLGFIEAEQGLLLGHSVHPAPRVREGEGADIDPAFVPELRGQTALHAWAIERERLLVGGGSTALALLDRLIAEEPAWAEQAATLGRERVLLPLHPLQHRALIERPELARALRRGELRPLGLLGRPWSPTSSLRTLHRTTASCMLKFSLPVRLTNSRRTLSIAELERGLLLGRVLEQTDAAALERRYPGFVILREPGWFGVRDDEGAGVEASFVALRDNPFADASAPVEMLATLLQDHPRTGRSRLALRLERVAADLGRRPLALVERWLEAFLVVVLEPIVIAQADYGLLLSAHQQNLVLAFAEAGELAGLLPTRAYFRDGQGTAYSELALRRYGEQLPGIEQACFRAPLAERLWSYSVVINSVFNVIASLAQVPGVAQELLLERLRAHLLELRERGPADPRALDYLLDSPQLWTKANVRCFAGGVDEVALVDPGTIYRPLANPLVRPAPALAPSSSSRARVAGFELEGVVELDEDRGRLQLDDATLEFGLQLASQPARLSWTAPVDPQASRLVADHLFSTHPELRALVIDDALLIREAFFQDPELWHHRGDVPPVEQHERVVSGGIDHPRRASPSASLLYRRHCPDIDRSFSLRCFEPERDFDRFCRWMNDPVVASFWEQAWPRERLRDYIEERLADPHVIPAIGSFDDLAFAYFEIYWAKEDRLGPHYVADDFDRGFHMAVGEAEVRHRGWGRQWFLAMAHFLFLDDPRTNRLVGEPRVDQALVRSWSTSTPWREWGEIQFPHKRAVLMVLTRERFFSSFAG